MSSVSYWKCQKLFKGDSLYSRGLLFIFLTGTSSVARAWSGTFDEMIGGHIEIFCKTYFSMNSPGLAQYPDFFAVCLILLLSGKAANIEFTMEAREKEWRLSLVHFSWAQGWHNPIKAWLSGRLTGPSTYTLEAWVLWVHEEHTTPPPPCKNSLIISSVSVWPQTTEAAGGLVSSVTVDDHINFSWSVLWLN